MSYYHLSQSNPFIYKKLQTVISSTAPDVFISNSLSTYLYDIKAKIDSREKEWDIYKKYTNVYEYIHTSVSHKKRAVSKYKPLSRSYFKMLELIQIFNLNNPDEKILNSFHLAEGPGGFIEAIANIRSSPNDKYVGMTIIDNEYNSYSIVEKE